MASGARQKGVHKKKVGKVLQWMTILGGGGQPPAYKRWTDKDEETRLRVLATTEDIDISNTQYGHMMDPKKRKLEAAVNNFSWEEQDAMQQKWDAMDVMDVVEHITSLQGEL